MNVKVAVLLALAFLASASLIATAPKVYAEELYSISSGFVECDHPAQPLGDPVEGGGVPHPTGSEP